MKIREIINELDFMGHTCTKDCSGHRAGYGWALSHGGATASTPSPSFNNGTEIGNSKFNQRKQGGGKFPQYVSQTPNAVRKRMARAQAKQQQATTVGPVQDTQVTEITAIESEDPLGDLIKQKTSTDPLDQLVNMFISAEQPKPVQPQTPAKQPAARLPAPQPQAKTIPAPIQAKPQPQPQQAAIPTRPGAVSWQAVSNYLAQKGLSKQHIIGMLANIEHESGFVPSTHVVDSNGLPSGGLFQHNGPRFQALQARLGPQWTKNWQGQVDYALQEPDGQKYIGLKFKDPHQASKWWTLHFERPAQATKQAVKRSQTAGKFAAQQSQYAKR